MTTAIQFAVLGLGIGAIYSLLAQGIVVIHRASGILNFSHGAMAMLAGFIFIDLRDDLGWAFGPACLASVAGVTLIGVLVYVLVMRPMRKGSALSRVIATLGILLILEAVATISWTSLARFTSPELPTGQIAVGGVTIGTDRLILLGMAIVLTIVLTVGSRYTRLGLATTAVSENERGVAALGWSPDRLAAFNWGLGSGLAAVAGVLIIPLTGLQVETMTLLVIPAIAAALIGGFTSFPITLVGAVLVGIVQSEMGQYVHLQGAAESLPFAVIVLIVIARGRSLPVRGHIGDRFAQLGSGRVRPALVVGLSVALAALILWSFSPGLNAAIATTLGVGTILLSIVVLTGYTGQLSLGQFALAGVGAVIAAKFVAGLGLPFEVAVVAGVVLTVPAGLLFGLPALRTRGMSLAAVTLGLGAAIQAMLFNNASYTGGSDGTAVGPQTLLGLRIDAVGHPERYAVVVLVGFLVSALVVASLRRGRAGRRLVAVRENERAAAALGISVMGAKLYAFAMAAAIAGLGGVLLGFINETVTYQMYTPIQSISAVAYAVVGGVGYVIGPLFSAGLASGGLGSYIFIKLLPSIDEYLLLLGGVFLIVSLLASANGMAEVNVRFAHQIAARLRRGRPDRDDSVEVTNAAAVAGEDGHRVRPATLAVSGVTVRFGGVVAVDDVSLVVEPGQIVGLIGPNGAGKTTLIDAVSGFVRPAAGEIRLNDEPLGRLSVAARARAGIGRSFQSLELFEDITVEENLRAASDSRDRRAYLTNLVVPGNRPLPAATSAAIREFGLVEALDKLPSELSYGQRRLVAMARAVSVRPSIVLLDEPAAGLSDVETGELATQVRQLADTWGVGILLVEHDMSFIMRVCDVITVLDFGREIAHGTPQEIRHDPAVIAAYLGGSAEVVDAAARPDSTPSAYEGR